METKNASIIVTTAVVQMKRADGEVSIEARLVSEGIARLHRKLYRQDETRRPATRQKWFLTPFYLFGCIQYGRYGTAVSSKDFGRSVMASILASKPT